MPAVPAIRISRPHGDTAVLLWTGGENIRFFAAAGWLMFHKTWLSGLNNRKRCRRFPGSSAAVIAMTAIPPRRAHGTLQPFGMKVS